MIHSFDMLTTASIVLFVSTYIMCLLYSALALTSEIGLHSSRANLAVASIVSALTTLPLSLEELCEARIGVGATAPNDIRLFPNLLSCISDATATDTTEITFSFRFAARIQ